MSCNLDCLFPRYTEFHPRIPVWCVTPNTGRTIHRFFDTSPFSPSGRYLGLTRLPFEDRLPSPGDVAEIVVVDLLTGQERVVAETRGWDTQLGAQVQWGATDQQLLYNDVDLATWNPFGVLLDPLSGGKRCLEGTVYMVSADGVWAVSPCLRRVSVTQPGYGVVVPPEQVPVNRGASAEDGLYVTHIPTGRRTRLLSLQEIVGKTLDGTLFRDGDFYSFHTKWNPQGDRLLLVLRWVPRRKGAAVRAHVVTMRADGSETHVAVPASEWDKGGHHPNWCPDGETVMMNLRTTRGTSSRLYPRFVARARKLASRVIRNLDDGMRLVRVRCDGNNLEVMADRVIGSGHPSLHPDGRYVLTDAYPNEPVAYRDGTVPIRLIDLESGSETNLIRIRTVPPYRGARNELRVDPHPAWDCTYRRIAFNACVDGTRRVYVADLSAILG